MSSQNETPPGDTAALAPLPFEQYALVIDARSPHEYLEDHLPGAVNLPLRKIEAEALRVLDPSRPVVVYCADPG